MTSLTSVYEDAVPSNCGRVVEYSEHLRLRPSHRNVVGTQTGAGAEVETRKPPRETSLERCAGCFTMASFAERDR